MHIAGLDWVDSPLHHGWLTTEANRLLDFYQRASTDNERGGFWWRVCRQGRAGSAA